MSNRKLASIMTVKEITPIDGKDFIVMVSFNECEWKVIGSKETQIGEKVLYIEYDSIIPGTIIDKMQTESSVNLKKRCFSTKYNGCVIRAMKMAGKISYGIMFREYEVVPYLMSKYEWDNLDAGADLTEKLGMLTKDDDSTQITVKEKAGFFRKWWSILLWKLFKIKKKKSGLGEWVPFIPRTDETRIQALPSDTLEKLQGKLVYIKEKLDGQSFTAAIFKGKFYICSRNQCLYKKPIKKAIAELIPANAHKQVDKFIATACRYDLARRMRDVQGDFFGGNDWALQGEQMGPGIQGNPCQLVSHELFVFNVFNIESQRYLDNDYMCRVVELLSDRGRDEALPMKTVPPITLPDGNFGESVTFAWKTVEELEELAKGKTFNEKGKHREGIVIRVKDSGGNVALPDRGMSNMCSFKVINPDFILSRKD